MISKRHWKIALKDIPSNVPIHEYIFHKTNIQSYIDLMSHQKQANFLATEINFELNALAQSTILGISKYGSYPFQYKDKTPDSSYLSTSINWNPNAIDKISENPHQGTLGSTLGKSKSIDGYTGDSAQSLGRNTYNDTYAFTKLTPFAKEGELGTLIKTFKRTLIRSRVSILNGINVDPANLSYGWHNDESIFINLRINIPLQSSDNYYIQIIDDINSNEPQISEFNLKVGKAYIYDTNKYHRPQCKKMDSRERINLILGVSPWFDFNEETQEWVSNEFYGEVHPFEMLKNKYITPLIGIK
jgi:hypothetical protein